MPQSRGRGRVIHTASLTFRPIPLSQGVSTPRIVVSTRVSKKATQRNKIKRRLREIWRKSAKGHPAPYIYVKKAALSRSFQDLKAEVSRAITQL